MVFKRTEPLETCTLVVDAYITTALILPERFLGVASPSIQLTFPMLQGEL